MEAPETILAEVGITFEEAEDLKEISFKSSIREQKLMDMKHLEVESDILRGISLRRTLRSFGAVWMKSAQDLSPDQRIERWQKSVKVDRFDLFLSHTWRTEGRWKFLSLLMQSSWQFFLVGWMLGILASLPFHLSDETPSLFNYDCESIDYESSCSFRIYGHYFGLIGWILALLVAPYWPGHRTCFLDVVSINQADEHQMEEGIYSIGGFLAVSSELQILWDRPYFGRLWCVFELAAFRTCNPRGKISLTPLFLEAGLALGLAMIYLHTALNWTLRKMGWPLELSMLLRLCALHPFFHYCRRMLHEKRQMICDLRHFQFAQVECGSDFDRDFIHAGIRAWYGSSEAFTSYVRGPLAEDLAEPFSRFRVPRAYWAVLAAPLASWELCWVFAITQSGAPIPAVLWVFRRRVAILSLNLIAIKLMVVVCDYFAQPSRLNCVKTSCIWAGLALFLFILWQSWFLLDAAGFISASVASSIIVVTAVIFVGEVWVDLTSLCRGRVDPG